MIYIEDTIVEIEAGTVDDRTAQEVYRNLQVLYGTETGEQALEEAKALLTGEFVRKTKQYEPRVRVMRVEWTQNHARDGGIVPKVVVSFV